MATNPTTRLFNFATATFVAACFTFVAAAAQPFTNALAPASNNVAQAMYGSSMAATASPQRVGAFQARVFTENSGATSNNAHTLHVADMDSNGSIDSGDLGLMLLNMSDANAASADAGELGLVLLETQNEKAANNNTTPSALLGTGALGLFAKNYLLAQDGLPADATHAAFYSVMDVYLKFGSAVGTGTAGERVVNFFGQQTTDDSTFQVDKTSKYENNLGLAFQHNNTSWLPGAGAAGGTGNNTWDSFLTVGARTQGAGATASVTPDLYFTNPNSNVASIIGGTNANGFVGAGVYQAAPTDAGWQTNASAYSDHMILFGRFTLKVSDIVAKGAAAKMTVWCDFVGKSSAQTGGSILYTLASANVKSDAQTKYTSGGRTWIFDPSFEGVTVGQVAWTFATVIAAGPAPTIASVSPITGPTTGATAITITGTNFTGATSVTVGDAAATNVVIVSPTQITAKTPAGIAGAQSVAVTTPGGTAIKTSAFTYVTPSPTISAITPTTGSTLGATAISITGTNFLGATSVKIGAVAATNVVVVSATKITAVTPAGSPGLAHVSVTTAGGTVTKENAFTYVISAPTISSVSPNSGPITGATAITITGTNFTDATSVKVGAVAATNVVVVSATQITALTPAGTAGAQSVSVTTAGGTATKANAFSYSSPPPTITSVSPTSGPTSGGTTITVVGTNFLGASRVLIGSAQASAFTVISATELEVITPPASPPSASVVSLVITTPGGIATKANAFSYVLAPTITSVTPDSGVSAGGTVVTIVGTNLLGADVFIGGVQATISGTPTATIINAITPASTSGSKSVAVTTIGGSFIKQNAFTYFATPTITHVSPDSGSTLGATAITITGTNFTGNSSVKIGGVSATNIVFVSETSITALTPAATAGAKPIVVTTPGGTSTQNITFTYVIPAPTIESVTPTSGTTFGGTAITITGTNFIGANSVTIGTLPATNVLVLSATQITAVTPASTAGPKPIVVTTPGGMTTQNVAFTFVIPTPTISSVTPTFGSTLGGSEITIIGTNLSGASSVKVGIAAATGVVVVNSTTIKAFTPTGTVGAKDVTVITPGGTASLVNAFTYQVLAPTITLVSPNAGSTLGGTSITITGTNFIGTTSVKIGAVAASRVIATSTQITALTPIGTIGDAKDVVVTTPSGSATATKAFTYYTPPTIASVTPATGSTFGSTNINITGANFVTGLTSVTVGGVAATSVVVRTPNMISAWTPAGTVGLKDVAVTTGGGSATLASAFNYFVPAPTLSAISPTTGSTLGATAITITGTNLTGASSVTVGGVAATNIHVVSSTSMTAVTPAGTAGAKTVVVTTAGGAATKTNAFTYVAPAPTISSVSPTSGSTAGGTAITITGANLTGASSVKVGGVAATNVVVVNDTSITAITPAGAAGAKIVAVTTTGGTATKTGAFTHMVLAPTISAVNPAVGSNLGGTAITITGTGFTGVTSVKIGDIAATNVVFVNATTITAKTPAATLGDKTIVVTTPGGPTTQPVTFKYAPPPPTITSVSPTSGSTLGGTAITITGTNFTNASSVMVGGVAATNVVAVSTMVITAVTPAGGVGAKPITVTTASGTASKANAFTYAVLTPTITSVSPPSGTTLGATAITITGTNFTGATSVKVGGVAATNIVVASATSITAITPANSAGAKPIVVTTPSGSTVQAITFLYVVPAPTLSSVTPATGSTLGATIITIVGTNLTGTTSVKVGGVAATNILVASATSITAKTPASAAGLKDVTVTTAGGTATKTGAFTYVTPTPTISSVTPATGSTLGATIITIVGINLTGTTSVKVGGVAATNIVVASATSITAKTPAGTVGAKDVTVTNTGGSATLTGAFTYVTPAPTISSVTPATGSTLGGTAITIAGTNLTGATSVTVGGIAATNIVVSASSITAKTPAGTAGAKSVAVTTAGGTATKASAFTYIVPLPTITSVSPISGPTTGGTTITITGTNLTGATMVKIGVTLATNVVVVNATSITAKTPAGTVGVKSVAVTTAGGTATKSNAFTYTSSLDGGNTPGAAGSSSDNGDVIASGNGNDANANASGGGANTSTANGNATSTLDGANTTSDIEAAAPMGIALYLQTVALRADAAIDCNINSDAFAGADLGDTFSGAVDSTQTHFQTATRSETIGECVSSISSAATTNTSGATTSTGPVTQTDLVNGATFAQFIDLDHNGVADMCQLRGGDLDLDGAITQSDMSILLNMIGLEPVLGIGDMDGNGVLDAPDVGVLLLRMQ